MLEPTGPRDHGYCPSPHDAPPCPIPGDGQGGHRSLEGIAVFWVKFQCSECFVGGLPALGVKISLGSPGRHCMPLAVTFSFSVRPQLLLHRTLPATFQTPFHPSFESSPYPQPLPSCTCAFCAATSLCFQLAPISCLAGSAASCQPLQRDRAHQP